MYAWRYSIAPCQVPTPCKLNNRMITHTENAPLQRRKRIINLFHSCHHDAGIIPLREIPCLSELS